MSEHQPSAYVIAALTTVDRQALETADTVVDLADGEDEWDGDAGTLDAIGQCFGVFADSLDHAIAIVHIYVAGRAGGHQVTAAVPVVVPEERIANCLPDERRAGMMCPLDLVVVFRRPPAGERVATSVRMNAFTDFCKGVLFAQPDDEDAAGEP